MKQALFTFTVFLIFLFQSKPTTAQFSEDFEQGSVFQGNLVLLSDRFWVFDNASLAGTEADKFNGSRGVRLNNQNDAGGFIRTSFDIEGGASILSFAVANYENDTGGLVQVSYSTDGGSTFINAGDPISAGSDLRVVSVAIDSEEPIRFQIQAVGGERINIDDFKVTEHITSFGNAKLQVLIDDRIYSTGSEFTYAPLKVNDNASVQVALRNIGNDPVTIESISVGDSNFDLRPALPQDTTLALFGQVNFELAFQSTESGRYTQTLSVVSNDPETPQYELGLEAESFADGEIFPISLARKEPLGATVRVKGIVSVADEFRGPVYFQDETGGLAWYDSATMRAGEDDSFLLNVERGDSIIVTGSLSDFNDLLQISGDIISYSIKPNETNTLVPAIITVEEMNSGQFEGQLVALNVNIEQDGILQGNSNYNITDQTGTGEMRINSFTNIDGAIAPEGTTTVTGVVGVFRGTYQLLPRDLNDIDAELVSYPGENVSKDLTFEVVTWNIEWFGSSSNGPSDDALQLSNVKEVIRNIDADVYAFQEIASFTAFQTLISDLTDYGGVLANYSQTQKTAYLFKRSTIDSLDSGIIQQGMLEQDWAGGRYPLMFRFRANIDGESEEFYAFNIHAKAFSGIDDYNQRLDASRQLKSYLDSFHPSDNIIFLGDYNDTTEGSISGVSESPYKNFIDDPEYTIITNRLEDLGLRSQSSGSMIDHITISSELSDEYIERTERVENTGYISSYLSTTSDHYPIWVRMQFENFVDIESDLSLPENISLSQNYPNPFNPTTLIRYELKSSTEINLTVYDLMGREVANLEQGIKPAGEHTVQFDASSLSSGIYLYRLQSSDGKAITRKMVLIK